ncbi:hypothetical protein ACS0TY_021709 [Phlomoides rotata]
MVKKVRYPKVRGRFFPNLELLIGSNNSNKHQIWRPERTRSIKTRDEGPQNSKMAMVFPNGYPMQMPI